MDVYEITGYATGISEAGVNYLQPADAFQNIVNGFIYRQVLQSRQGIGYFTPRLNPLPVGIPPTVITSRRVFGIFEHTLPDSTKELLAFDDQFLYKYNTTTGIFDQIPFAGSMVNYSGFNISANDLYISGTSYPTATNGARFVFTGEGIQANAAGSSVFFYNGTDVRDFTSLVDNPNYQAPALGAFNYASYVVWFNERLNFIVPVIAGIEYNQGVLFSGIRTTSGNGDKFNVAGSGLFQADTYQNITGVTILGQVLALNFDRMAYTLEKTRDAFNPYFGRAVPGVLGTNAKFSAVSWNETVRSLGKTGILGQDGRQNLRVDNKIPYFTANDIDQLLFNLTYGGFDRLNNQFLWAYKISETDTDTQNSVLVGNYEENTWSVFDQRFSVFGQSDLGLNLNWDDIEYVAPDGDESWAEWDTTTDIWDRIGLGQAVQKTLAGDDLGFIYQLNKDFDDYINAILTITPGTTTVIGIPGSGFIAGDLVTISNVGGMTELNNFDTDTGEYIKELYTVVSATSTSVTIDVDSSLFSAYTTGGSISKPINFSAETIPFNPYRSQGRRCYVSHVEFLIECNGGSLKVDIFADQEETPFKQNILMQPSSDLAQKAEWLDMTVDQEANFLTFVLKQQSPAVQLRLTSMRIHCQPGGLTHG